MIITNPIVTLSKLFVVVCVSADPEAGSAGFPPLLLLGEGVVGASVGLMGRVPQVETFTSSTGTPRKVALNDLDPAL